MTDEYEYKNSIEKEPEEERENEERGPAMPAIPTEPPEIDAEEEDGEPEESQASAEEPEAQETRLVSDEEAASDSAAVSEKTDNRLQYSLNKDGSISLDIELIEEDAQDEDAPEIGRRRASETTPEYYYPDDETSGPEPEEDKQKGIEKKEKKSSIKDKESDESYEFLHRQYGKNKSAGTEEISLEGDQGDSMDVTSTVHQTKRDTIRSTAPAKTDFTDGTATPETEHSSGYITKDPEISSGIELVEGTPEDFPQYDHKAPERYQPVSKGRQPFFYAEELESDFARYEIEAPEQRKPSASGWEGITEGRAIEPAAGGKHHTVAPENAGREAPGDAHVVDGIELVEDKEAITVPGRRRHNGRVSPHTHVFNNVPRSIYADGTEIDRIPVRGIEAKDNEKRQERRGKTGDKRSQTLGHGNLDSQAKAEGENPLQKSKAPSAENATLKKESTTVLIGKKTEDTRNENASPSVTSSEKGKAEFAHQYHDTGETVEKKHSVQSAGIISKDRKTIGKSADKGLKEEKNPLFRVFNRNNSRTLGKRTQRQKNILLRKSETESVTIGKAHPDIKEPEYTKRSSKNGLVNDTLQTGRPKELRETTGKSLSTGDDLLNPGKRIRTLSDQAQEAKTAYRKLRHYKEMTTAAAGTSTQAAAPQTMPFTAKIKAVAKMAAKKVVAGSLIGSLVTGAFAGGYVAVDRDSSSMWYPVQAHISVDGSDSGTALTQDAVTKMFTRLSAYGIRTSFDTEGAAGPLTIHIPGYEAGSGDVRWGDSQIILTGSGNCLLIDGGCGILTDMTVEYLKQKGVTSLTAIITHWHGDHYTGLATILNDGSIHVDSLYCPPPEEIEAYDSAESYAGRKICEAVEEQGGRVTHPNADENTNFNLFGINIDIWRKHVSDSRHSEISVNESSMQIYFPDLYYLTTGDIVYSLSDYLETMSGRTIKLFEVPHHGNGSRTAMASLSEFGAEACWYNNVPPGGNMDNSSFPVGAKAARAAGYEVFNTLGDINITAAGGMMSISANGKYYSYSCPYNPTGEAGGNKDLASYAKQWVGKIPYKSSVTGNDPNNERFEPLAVGRGSDCSWFVYHCLEHFGILDEFVHSYEWGSQPDKYPGGRHIGTDLSQAQPGDILCYAYGSGKSGNRQGSNSHVGIYIGDGKQVECSSGPGNVVESSVDKSNLIQIVRFDSASTGTSYMAYTGGEAQTRHGFTTQTEAIVEQHMNDFNYDTFDSFMAARGGVGNYIRSLGGVFTKWYGRTANVQTAGEFQEIAEYVMGLYTLWGPDYKGGSGIHLFNDDYGTGNRYGRFYTSGGNNRWWIIAPIDRYFVSDKEYVMTDCGCGIYHIMEKAGLMDDYAGMESIASAERYLEKNNCYSQGGKIITRKEDLQVGDLVQMIRDGEWHHVAVVGEVCPDGKFILYDTGNRYVNTGNHKKELVIDGNGLHGDYEGYDTWFGVRVKQLSQTGGLTSGMATQDLKEIKIASVRVDGDTIDKSGFKINNLREFSSGGKQTSSVTLKFRFVDEKGEEIKGLSTTQGTSPVSYTGGSSASGVEIKIPEGLGSVHTYMGWQCITSVTSNQYRLREEAGENYDSEGFAIIDGRYAIACTPKYGNVGDYVDFYKEDGLVLHCVIGEMKNTDDSGCTEWGHSGGKNILEFLVDKDTWYSGGHGAHDNPGTASCHPEWASTITKAVNLGPRAGGSSTMLAAGTQGGEYDAQAVQLVKQILSMSVAGSYYKDPVNVSDYDWYCFDLLDYAVCEYHGADVEYTTGDETIACTATVTVCCSLPGLEESDNNFTSWEHHLVGGDYMPKSYMTLSKKDYEELFNVDLTIPQKLSQVVFSGTEQEVYSFFLSKGLGAAQIAGIMANIKAESGFNPSAQNASGASGLFQWMGGRLQALKDLASASGTDWTDVRIQLEYAWKEIQGDGWNGHSSQKEQFMDTSSAFQAAVLFCNYFERCGIASEGSRRGKIAEEYYAQIMSAGAISNINYVQWAINTANDDSHGYSQARRYENPDYDCSSFVYYALKYAGYDVGPSAFTTYTMGSYLERVGFRKISISSYSELMPGDILWRSDHTEIYIGDGKRVGAHSSYGHTEAGDQAEEVSVKELDAGWYYVFRKTG